MTMRRGRRDLCDLMCDEPVVTSISNIRLCAGCVARIRAITADAKVVIDEGMLTGTLRPFRRHMVTRAERELEAKIERREIAAAAAAAKRRSA